MKYYVLLFLCLLLQSCASSRKVSTVHTRDSVTTTTARPITLSLPADSVKGGYTFSTFSQELQRAKPGATIAKKTNKGISFTVVKSDDTNSLGFSIQAATLRKDTTIFVHDTLRIVTDKTFTETVITKDKTLLEKIKEYSIYLFLLLVILILLVRKFIS